MRKLLLATFCLLPLATISAYCQTGFTSVTGQVLDPGGNKYVRCTITANFVDAVGATKQATLNGFNIPSRSISGGCDSNANIVGLTIYDSAVVQPSGSTWQFTVCSTQQAATSPGTVGQPQNPCFSYTAPTCPNAGCITGVSINIGAALSAIAPSLGVSIAPGSVGGTIFPALNNTYSLGTPSFQWLNGYFSNLPANMTLGGSNIFTGSSNTFSNLNKVVVWDGVTYALTSAGLQSAINAACNGTNPGTVNLTPVQVTGMSAQVSVPNNCEIAGASQTATKLTFLNSINANLVTPVSTSPTNIKLHDFTVDGGSGTGNSQAGISLAGNSPTDITIDRVTVQNVGQTGIAANGAAGNLGVRVNITNCKVANAGLAAVASTQYYGIVNSFNSQSKVEGCDVSGSSLTLGINGFSSVNANAATPVKDLSFSNNFVHDITGTTQNGAGIDIGRVNGAKSIGNHISNITTGGCVTFEAVWHGKMDDICVSPSKATQALFLVKTPDTTQSGEVASQDIDMSGVAACSPTCNAASLYTVNGAQRGIRIRPQGWLNTTSSVTAVNLQLGMNDANINASSQNFCNNVSVIGGTLQNAASLGGNTSVGVSVQQQSTNCIVDQVQVSGVATSGFNAPVLWQSATATDGITHLYVHDNPIENNNQGVAANDAHTYNKVWWWNNLPATGSGLQSNIIPTAGGTLTLPSLTAPLTATIASGTAAMTTAAITAGNCGTTVTVSASGVLTTDSIIPSFNAAPAGSNAGLVSWPTANNVNFAYCPNSAETPAAATINWRVMR